MRLHSTIAHACCFLSLEVARLSLKLPAEVDFFAGGVINFTSTVFLSPALGDIFLVALLLGDLEDALDDFPPSDFVDWPFFTPFFFPDALGEPSLLREPFSFAFSSSVWLGASASCLLVPPSQGAGPSLRGSTFVLNQAWYLSEFVMLLTS